MKCLTTTQKKIKHNWLNVCAQKLFQEGGENTQKIEYNMGVEGKILYPLLTNPTPSQLKGAFSNTFWREQGA